MFTKALVITQAAASLLASLIVVLPATAAPAAASSGDYFGRSQPNKHLPTSAKPMSTSSGIGAGAGAMMSNSTAIVRWFESFDDLVGNALPTASEKMILSRPLNQEVERVQQLTKVYGDIATRYRHLAKTLKSLPVQADWPGVQEYRDAEADFYTDEAQVYEDLIKPRRAAKTIEDLKDQLNEVEQRSAMLKKNGQGLLAADRALRKRFSVHAPRYNDALWAYVSHKQGVPTK